MSCRTSFLYSMPLLAHLRCASVYQVTIKSASCGRPCGIGHKKIPLAGGARGTYALVRGGLLAVYLLHAGDEVEHLVRVADLVVIPANNLNEGRGELDTSLGVEDRSAGVAEEVA